MATLDTIALTHHRPIHLGWLDYAQHCGFATDPTRVRHVKHKPRVERAVHRPLRALIAICAAAQFVEDRSPGPIG
ncbi:MAG: hypothetical protein ACRDSL_02865 [Pseudonocardiaceae bacterium]